MVSVNEAIEKSDKEAESETEGTTPHTVVQFGQVCSKKWTQVYYLKVCSASLVFKLNTLDLNLQLCLLIIFET